MILAVWAWVAGNLSPPEASVSSVGSSSSAVVLGHEEVTNGEEIASELFVVASSPFVRNHVEGTVVLGDRAFKELKSKSCEPVAMGDHNLFDATALDGVQKGE